MSALSEASAAGAPGRTEPVPGWHRESLGTTRDDWPLVRIDGARPGPGILIVGEAGDGLAGAALAALAVELDPAALAGRCTLVPACTLDDPAALDEIERRLLGDVGLVLEIGGADAGLHWSPTAIVRLSPGARRGARAAPAAEDAMIAFGATESLRLRVADPDTAGRTAIAAGPRSVPDIDLGAPPERRGGALAARAARLGVAHVQVRRGGAGDIGGESDALASLRTGCRNVLIGTGALAAALELRVTRHLELGPCGGGPDGSGASRASGATVRAGAHGTLAMALAPGADVHAGAVLARLLDPNRPEAEPAELLAPCDGALLACRGDGPVSPGERIALIAEEMQP